VSVLRCYRSECFILTILRFINDTNNTSGGGGGGGDGGGGGGSGLLFVFSGNRMSCAP